MEELKEMLKKVTDALDDTAEDLNYGVYDDLIKEARETLNKFGVIKMDINNLNDNVEVEIYNVSDYTQTVIYKGKLSGASNDMLKKVKDGSLLLKKKPEYVSNGIINVPKILIEYRGYNIEPKLDFGGQTYQGAGYICSKGYVITDGVCNVMPGATWSHDIIGAKAMIDTLIESKETGKDFWTLLREKQGMMEWAEV